MASHGDELWADGAKAYARYAEELAQDYADVLTAAGERRRCFLIDCLHMDLL